MAATGIVLPYWSDVNKQDLLYFSKLAEDLGYDSIWVPEMWGRDAFSLISFIAAATERIKFATGIISVYSRSPAIIAQTAATIDEYSGGRMIIGLGMSTALVNELWHGAKFEKPLTRTKEYVEIIRTALGGGRVNYNGEIFSLRNFKLLFKPIRNEIPIHIASIGPKNIELTSRIADGWVPYMCSMDFVRKQKKILESNGRNISINPFFPALVSNGGSEAKEVVREFVAYYICSMGDYYRRLVSGYGYAEEAEKAKKLWKENKAEAVKCVSDGLLDLICVTGSAEDGRKKLEKFASEVNLPILMFPYRASKEQIVFSMKALAPVG